MRVLDRYIVLALARHTGLVLLVLMVLVALFLFVNEQGWIAGNYGQAQALRHVLAQLPGTLLQFLPVAALLGALLAMGELARGSELTVMRAAGVSVARIAGSVALAGTALLLPAVVIGEWIAPPLAQSARVAKALERNGQLNLSQGAAWMRDGARMFRAEGGGLMVFELTGSDRLGAIILLPAEADRRKDAAAVAKDQASRQQAQAVHFSAAGTARREHDGADLRARADADLFALATADPRQQSLRTLQRTVAAARAAGQEAPQARFALWSGIARLAAVPLAMLLCVPLLLGFLRGSGTGARASLGLLLGLGWFIAQRIVENGTLAFGFDAALAAMLPTLLLALIVAVLLWRTRRISAA